MKDYKYIGKDVTRIDALEKISGAAIYGDDIDFGANLLYAELVQSTMAHAIIKSIDTSEALKVKGVYRIFTGKDFPYKFGLYMKDRYIFAQDKVRFVGEQIAAVIAFSPGAAKRAAELVKVEYEALPAVLDQMEALKDDATLLHPELEDYPHVP